jgi:hypothetical protein
LDDHLELPPFASVSRIWNRNRWPRSIFVKDIDMVVSSGYIIICHGYVRKKRKEGKEKRKAAAEWWNQRWR